MNDSLSNQLFGLSTPSQPPQEEEGFLTSLALAPVRGIAGAAAGVANLFGADVQDNFGLGHSQGFVPGLTEGVVQFLTGFIPVAGALGKVGALSKAAQGAALVSKGRAAAVAVGAGRAAVAGATADFLAFDGNDPRLSNLIQTIPELQNPVTEFLASKAEDGEVLGRMKNVIEGAGLGLAADGILALFRAGKRLNKAVSEGDAKAAKVAEEDMASAAEDTLLAPSEADIEVEQLLDPTQPLPRKPERDGLPDPQDPQATPATPQTPAAPAGPDQITMEDARKRISYNAADGDVILVNAKDTSGVIRGLSQWDSYAREPGARLEILQLKGDARVLRGGSKEARKLTPQKRKSETPEQYADRRLAAAKAAGYDAVQVRKGKQMETVVLNPDAVARRINVLSGKSFWAEEAISNAIKDPKFVATSPLERALVASDLSPDKVANIRNAFEDVRVFAEAEGGAPVTSKDEVLGKLAGALNFDKLGSRDARALSYVITQEIPFEKLADPKVPLAQQAEEALRATAKALGQDPAVAAKQLHVDADNLAAIRRRALGAKFLLTQVWGKQILSLMSNIRNSRAVLDSTGRALTAEESAEMLGRMIKNWVEIGSGLSRVRSSFGRNLGGERLGVDDLMKLKGFKSLDGKVNVKWALSTAKKFTDDVDVGGLEHALGVMSRMGRRERAWAAVKDWYMFSLLSAPKTLTTNGAGSLATAFFRPFESRLGSWVGQKLLGADKALELQKYAMLQTAKIRIMREMFSDMMVYRAKAGPDAQQIYQAVGRAYKTGEGQLLKQASVFDNGMGQGAGISAENLGEVFGKEMDPTKGMGKVLETVGSVTRIPSRVLGGTDEFIKQVSAFAHVKASLQMVGLERGLKDADLDQFIDGEMRNMIRNGELLNERLLKEEAEQVHTMERYADPSVRDMAIRDHINKSMDDNGVTNRRGILDEAATIAREVTFTTDLDPQRGLLSSFGSMMQKFALQHPVVSFFAPFIRTPLNILMFVGDRLPIPGINKDFLPFVQYLGSKMLGGKLDAAKNRFVRALADPDPRVAAEAFGRATTAMGILTVGGTAAATGVITGRGPEDPEQRKLLEETGWAPYSIKVGDTYVSYQRLDPFASMLAFFGDYADIVRYGGGEAGVADIGLGWVMATMTNLESKSYLSGVTDLVELLSDPVKNFEKSAGRIAGSLVVPNVLAAARSFTDPYKPELDGILDRVIARVPFMSSSIDPQRNMLGEPMSKKTFGAGLREVEGFANYMLPIGINHTSSDVVTQEMANLGYPFSLPRPEKFGVDLRDYQNATGQSAYDRWMELTGEVSLAGRKLRPALERMINSNQYKSLESESLEKLDVDSPRVVMLNGLIGRYRREAERKMLEEFPVLRDHTRAQRIARQSLRTGADADEVRASLFPQER